MSSLIFMDGFDHYEADEADDFEKKWDEGYNTHETESIVAAGRFGGSCVQSYDAIYQSAYFLLRKNLDVADQTIIVGAAVKFTDIDQIANYNGILSLDNGNSASYPEIVFGLTDSYVPIVYRKTGVTNYSAMFSGESSLDTNTWYYFELMGRVHPTLGKCELRIDGESLGTYEGDTQYASPTQTSNVYVGIERPIGEYQWIDDVYIASGEDFYGDSRIDCIYPIASGEVTELTAVGAPDNFECVSGEQFNDDVSGEWVQGAYGTDSYIFGNCGVSGEIYGIQLAHISNRTEPVGGMNSKNIIRKGSVNYSGETHDETDDIEYKTACFDEDPSDDSSWSPAKVDACEFGVEFE